MGKQTGLEIKKVFEVYRDSPCGKVTMALYDDRKLAEAYQHSYNSQITCSWDKASVSTLDLNVKAKERVGLKIVELIRQIAALGYSVALSHAPGGMRIVCKLMDDGGIAQLNTTVTGEGVELEKNIIATLEEFRKNIYDEC